MQTPEGDKIECMIRLDFPTTNNEAEYEALVAGLDLARAAGAGNMIIHCDSQVITSQINGDFECRNERMKKYLEEVRVEPPASRSNSFRSQGRKTSAPTVWQKQPPQNS